MLSSDSIPERPSTTPPTPPPVCRDEEGLAQNPSEPRYQTVDGDDDDEEDQEQHIITMTSSSSSSSPSLPSPLGPIPNPNASHAAPSSPLALPATVVHSPKVTPLNVKKRVLHPAMALLTPPDSSSKVPKPTQQPGHDASPQSSHQSRDPSVNPVSPRSADSNPEGRLAALNIQDQEPSLGDGDVKPFDASATPSPHAAQHPQRDQRPRFFSQYNPSPQKSPQFKQPHSSPDPFYNPNSTTNVYINGLAPFFKMEELARLASEFGKVLSCRVFHRFNQTKPNGGGQQQGSTYAFVLYETIEDATRCITALRKYSDLHPSFARTQRLPGARGTQPTTAAGLLDKNRPAYQGSPDRASGSPRPSIGHAPRASSSSSSAFPPPDAAGNFRPAVEEAVDVLIQGLPATADIQVVESLLRPHQALNMRLLPIGTEPNRDSRKIAYVRLASLEAAKEIFQRLHSRSVFGWSDPDSGSAASVKLQVTIITPVESSHADHVRNQQQLRAGTGTSLHQTQQSRYANIGLLPFQGMQQHPHRAISMPIQPPIAVNDFNPLTTQSLYSSAIDPRPSLRYNAGPQSTSNSAQNQQTLLSPYPHSQLRHHMIQPAVNQPRPRGPPIALFDQTHSVSQMSHLSKYASQVGLQTNPLSNPVQHAIVPPMTPRLDRRMDHPRLHLQTAMPFMSGERASLQQRPMTQMRSASGPAPLPFRGPLSSPFVPNTLHHPQRHSEPPNQVDHPRQHRNHATPTTSPRESDGEGMDQTLPSVERAEATHLQVGARAIPMRVNISPLRPNHQYTSHPSNRLGPTRHPLPEVASEADVSALSPTLGGAGGTMSTQESWTPATPTNAEQETPWEMLKFADDGQDDRERGMQASTSVPNTDRVMRKPSTSSRGRRRRRTFELS
ncbi:hypothetical protein FRB98_006392 [Tulasnella sp. 332]|nr:hypothetical protein FRB98_006392 [Tulasnella sp. 332]